VFVQPNTPCFGSSRQCRLVVRTVILIQFLSGLIGLRINGIIYPLPLPQVGQNYYFLEVVSHPLRMNLY